MQSTKEFLDLKETMEAFGGSLGFWRSLIFRRTISSFRRGDRVILKRSDIEAYLSARRVPALSEVAGEARA